MAAYDRVAHLHLDTPLEEDTGGVPMINIGNVCRPMTEEEIAEQAELDAEFFAERDAKKLIITRNLRDKKLSYEVDPVITNPIRWAELTSEKQEEWKAYRLALLSVPQQDGFPTSVTWPTKPE